MYAWTFDSKRQTLKAPSGWTITVREIAQELQDRTHCRVNLEGPWAGWKIRGKTMTTPQGHKWTPDSLRKFGTVKET
ncbi:MAG: hypothetical protein WC859_10595 [Elusimicrobiota bacterium]